MMIRLLSVLILVGIIAVGCSGDESETSPTGPRFPESQVFEKLSDYRLFEGSLSDLKPVEGVLPYDLNSPLFTDHASKFRFVYVPNGDVASYDTTDVLTFPKGTILVKNFYYTLQSGEDFIIETRLLLHQSSGWNLEVYEWNDEQTEAYRNIVGNTKPLSFVANGQSYTVDYVIPNKNQCKNCHARGNDEKPIGPVVQNLNKNYSYSDGVENQLTKWVEAGILEQPNHSEIPAWADYTDETRSLNDRARVYLEVNCAHCHQKNGSAYNSGLFLNYYNTDSLSLGFNKTPVAAGAGSGGLDYVIVKGDADASILHYRMNSTSTKVMMPELGRTLIDEEGVALIREWINSIE
ncbi:SO2930 family diheme c-type cytochrome [Mangrovivirga cuniculi]|nr:SO2930 family diheme c-type cytochrome [Mangrovivirga cuniculi]